MNVVWKSFHTFRKTLPALWLAPTQKSQRPSKPRPCASSKTSNSSPLKTSPQRPSWRPKALASPTSTPKATQENAGTAGVRTSTSSNNSPSTAPKSCSAQNTPTSSHTLAPKPTWLFISQCYKPATASSPWIWRTGVISPTETKPTSLVDCSTSFITGYPQKTSASITITSRKWRSKPNRA